MVFGALEGAQVLCVYSAFRFEMSALLMDFPHYVSHNRPEYMLLGRNTSKAKQGVPALFAPYRSASEDPTSDKGAWYAWWK